MHCQSRKTFETFVERYDFSLMYDLSYVISIVDPVLILLNIQLTRDKSAELQEEH